MKGFHCNECGQEAHWQGVREGKRILGLTKCHYHKPSAFHPIDGIYYVLLAHCHCWRCHKFADPAQLIWADEKGEPDIEGKPYCPSCLAALTSDKHDLLTWMDEVIYDPQDDATNEITGGTMPEGDE